VNTLTLFGLIAVSTMLIAYALEDRSRAFVRVFAAACAASSAYGFLERGRSAWLKRSGLRLQCADGRARRQLGRKRSPDPLPAT
jgi:hypothetical protein